MELGNQAKLKRTLGFWAALGGSVGLVVSGTAMVAVANVGGIAGSGAWLPALIALIPMLAVAAAYGELTAMFPGGGMIGDYTMPTLGKFWSLMAILFGYVLLIACDGGTQQIVGALAFERITGIPYLITVAVIIVVVASINLFGVQFYGSFEIFMTVAMMLIFFALAILGFMGVGGGAPVNAITPFAPENGWMPALSCAGTAIWWYIGFEFVCPMAEENKKPHKNIPYALIIGLVMIFLADIFFIYGGVKYLDLETMATSSTPHIDIALATLGNAGFVVMTVITILACLTTAVAHMAALPRMLYGLAHKQLVPRCFAYIHPKFRTPWVGIFFTGGLMLITVVYMIFKGTEAEIMIMLVNIACCTWLISYAIALINILIYRKKYPDYPRLWKAPFGPALMVIGLLGIAYCMWTLNYVWLISGIAIVVFLAYGVIWFRYKKIPLGEKEPIHRLVRNIQNRSESLPEWDDAVNAWIKEKGLE